MSAVDVSSLLLRAVSRAITESVPSGARATLLKLNCWIAGAGHVGPGRSLLGAKASTPHSRTRKCPECSEGETAEADASANRKSQRVLVMMDDCFGKSA